MAEILSRTRLPQPRRSWIKRQRVLEALYAALDSRLILIVAGAGYGKTSLLAQFARTEGFTFSWLLLDEGEQDLRVFGESLVASIAQCFPGFGQQAMQLLMSASAIEQNIPTLSRTIVRELSANLVQPLCIVLDDFQLVESSVAVVNFVDRLVSDLPDDVHLIIVSRSLPPLQLGVLIAQQQVSALGQSMLRLDLDETRQLMAMLGGPADPGIDEQAIARLHADTQGWLVGVLMTNQVSRMREAHVGLSSPRASDLLGDYLMASVFRGLPVDLQAFLFRSSVLDEMSLAFCQQELKWADTAAWINEIERRNLFIQPVSTAGDGDPVYRYHPLFREFLLQRFKEDEPIRLSELQREVGAAYERAGNAEMAIRHFVHGGWSDDIMRVIEARGLEFLGRSRYRTVLDWFARLDSMAPTARAERHVLLQLELLARINLGHDREAMRIVDQLDQLFLKTGDLRRRDGLNIRRGLLLWRAGDYRNALAGANIVIQSPYSQPLFAQVDARRIAALCLLELGRLDEGLAVVNDGEKLVAPTDPSSYGLLALVKLARYVLLDGRGDPRGALVAASEAAALAEGARDDRLLADSSVSLAEGLLLNDQIDQAARHAERGLELAETTGNLIMRVVGMYVLSKIRAAQGKLAEALVTNSDALALARNIQPSTASSGETLFLPLTEQCHLLCLQSQLPEYADQSFRLLGQAVAMAREAVSAAEASQSVLMRLRAYARLGAVQVLQGDLDLALETLAHAESLCGLFKDVAVGLVSLWQLLALTRQPKVDVDQVRRRLEQVKEFSALRGGPQFVMAEGANVWRAYQAVRDADLSQLQRLPLELVPRRARDEESRSAAQPASAPQVRMVQHELHARGFGSGKVWRNSELITAAQWGWNIPRELLFYMLTARQATRDQIGTLFWPDASTATMQRSFHNSKFSVRLALGRQPFVYANGQYSVSPELDYIYDVEEFDRLLHAAAATAGADRLELLLSAADLYQDDFMVDSEFDWPSGQRQLLAVKFAQCCCDAGAAALQLSQPDAAISLLERAAQRDELNEEIVRMLMTLCWKAGKRHVGLDAYVRLEDALEREMDIRPEASTRQLFATIRES